MSIPQDHRNVGMAQEFANRIEIYAGLNQAACKMMALIPPAELTTHFSRPLHLGESARGTVRITGLRPRAFTGMGCLSPVLPPRSAGRHSHETGAGKGCRGAGSSPRALPGAQGRSGNTSRCAPTASPCGHLQDGRLMPGVRRLRAVRRAAVAQ